MARPQKPETAAAVAWVLAHPGCVLAGVAQAYGIHRVTLCVALKNYRKTCPTCGHPVRVTP